VLEKKKYQGFNVQENAEKSGQNKNNPPKFKKEKLKTKIKSQLFLQISDSLIFLYLPV
jgi:hypothetical protein